ncbi:MAG: Na+:solute symporter [Victivallales bacterium]|nr:Na+:solute symporter [Victivallales bacterium]
MLLNLSFLDWAIVAAFFAITLGIGLSAAKLAGRSLAEYFVGGRSMPWWLLGFSMVATTFSTDVPNLVTNFVREKGVFGNWGWWAMLPSGMLTVFLYAKLWRRSGTITDLEYYEIRYSGKMAAWLRGFRAVYLGLFFNAIVMASVNLAAIKIGAAMLNLTPVQSILGAMVITAFFSAVSGLRGVLLSDFVLFVASMVGAIGAAVILLGLPEIGGLSGLMDKLAASPELLRKTEVMGWSNKADFIAMFLIPITIVWWSVWYPGSEPGGGGFIVQRMLAAKNEEHAVGATLFFNVAHYALRPWPWILVALCSLIVYPDRASLVAAVGSVLPESQIQSDVAYSLMLTRLPVGWVGLMVASLCAAYVSTQSTLVNWGASYLVNDFYGRFIQPRASERRLVNMGRICTVLLMVVSGVLSLFMESAMNNFNIILSIGAGTGLLFMVRWYWWRINAAAEVTAMVSSFVFALYFNLLHPCLFPNFPLSASENMIYAVALTTLCWVLAAIFGPRTDDQVLFDFVRKINPGGPGWNAVRLKATQQGVSLDNPNAPAIPLAPGILASFTSCLCVYALLIGTGDVIFGHWGRFVVQAVVALVSGVATYLVWKRAR